MRQSDLQAALKMLDENNYRDAPIFHWVHPAEMATYKAWGLATPNMRVYEPIPTPPIDTDGKSVHTKNQKRSA